MVVSSSERSMVSWQHPDLEMKQKQQESTFAQAAAAARCKVEGAFEHRTRVCTFSSRQLRAALLMAYTR